MLGKGLALMSEDGGRVRWAADGRVEHSAKLAHPSLSAHLPPHSEDQGSTVPTLESLVFLLGLLAPEN